MKALLITGGTGFLGKILVDHFMKWDGVERIVIYSRRWNDQEKLQLKYQSDPNGKKLRFITGDIRDLKSLSSAMRGIDTVIHTAAYKHVTYAEYNPREVISVNIDGSQNVIDAAIANGVEQVLAISSDKAVDAYNLYGKTKAVMESMMVSANNLGDTRFNVARYGNVWWSTGSVVERWGDLLNSGDESIVLNVTNPDMTRFYIMKKDLLQYMETCLRTRNRGLILLPLMKSASIGNLAEIFTGVASDYDLQADVATTGIRAGEKMHESLVSGNEKHILYRVNSDTYALYPAIADWGSNYPIESLKEDDIDKFRSDTATEFDQEELRTNILVEL